MGLYCSIFKIIVSVATIWQYFPVDVKPVHNSRISEAIRTLFNIRSLAARRQLLWRKLTTVQSKCGLPTPGYTIIYWLPKYIDTALISWLYCPDCQVRILSICWLHIYKCWLSSLYTNADYHQVRTYQYADCHRFPLNRNWIYIERVNIYIYTYTVL